MEIFHIGIVLMIMCVLAISARDTHERCCKRFSSIMRNAKSSVQCEQNHNSILERIGFVTPHSIFGVQSYDECVDAQVINAKVHRVGAQTFKKEFNMSVNDFELLADQCNYLGHLPYHCMKDSKRTIKERPKYRSIDGRGNNLKNPDWGVSGTPFSRFGSRNYEDGIFSIKKSVTGSDLPKARLLVQEILTKAVRSPPPPLSVNVLGLTIILFATHDLHYQVPMQPRRADQEILCCSHDRHNILPPSLSNSACLPIEISKDDSFYKDGEIGCLNMVRSQIGEPADKTQGGEILNHATAYLDLSLIYGNHESELKQLRLYRNGKLRMGKNHVLPVDLTGKYLQSMNRFVAVPIASIWPALFARNHNHLAERLAALNPHWKDEIVFQEARRINIANFQFNLINAKTIERVFGTPINETYSDQRNAATSLEFAFAYRAAHYYIPSDMLFQNGNSTTVKQIPQSDTIGKISLLEKDFDDALRGVAYQPVNVGPYSDEVLNKKN